RERIRLSPAPAAPAASLARGRPENRMNGMQIREATETDVPEIQSIYAHHVLTGTGTFEEEPPSVEEMAARFRKVVDSGCSWLVAVDDSGVLGFAYYNQFR